MTLHVLAAVVWVGGMFFAYMAQRPAALGLEPAHRLALWARTFARFFPWVWAAVVILPVTGLWMIDRIGGFGVVPTYVHVMTALAAVMIAIFVYVFFAPYRRLARAVAAGDYQNAAAALASIRRAVAVNLTIGLALITIVVAGKHWAG